MLAGRAKLEDSPFDFNDASIQDHLPGDWKEARRKTPLRFARSASAAARPDRPGGGQLLARSFHSAAVNFLMAAMLAAPRASSASRERGDCIAGRVFGLRSLGALSK